MNKGILSLNGYFFFLEKCEIIKFGISFWKKKIFLGKTIKIKMKEYCTALKLSVTIEKCLILETPLDKVPYTFKVKYTYCSGNGESVPMCVFL